MKKYVTLGEVCTKGSSNIAQKDIEQNNGSYGIYGASGYIKDVDFYHQDKPYIAVVKDGAGIGRTMLLPEKTSVIGTMQYLIPKDNVCVEYLYYAVTYMNLAKYFSGATIPHIYFKDYQKEKLPLLTIEEQRKIADNLRKIDRLIELCSGILQKLDVLVKSRFVEMFGEPVSNTMNWDTVQLGELTTKIGSGATPKGGRESYGTEGISLIRSMNVHNGYFEYKDLAHISDEQAKKLDNVTVHGKDVLLNITGASVARCCIVPNHVLPARVNQHVCIIRCKANISPVFLCCVLTDENYQNHLWNIAGSGATREAITKQQVENLSIIVPPLALQEQFAAFVEQTDKSKFIAKKIAESVRSVKIL